MGKIYYDNKDQATPSAIPALRYLYEEKPDLHVYRTGSLLEFILNEHNYSMPVGRIKSQSQNFNGEQNCYFFL